MDTSISKALIMAAGVLLAMLVVGFMVYSFRSLSSWSETTEQKNMTAQVEKFNKEYEAYDKDLMYGVDVLSCLNKALSNNDKVDDGTYAATFGVTVNVTFKEGSTLEESFRVYYLTRNSNREQSTVVREDYTNGKYKVNTSVTKETAFHIVDYGRRY